MNQTENKESVKKSSPSLPNTVEELNQRLESLSSIDEKIKLALEFMETSISQKGTPNFKVFWESRKTCLELLKSEAVSLLRSMMWPKLSDLTKEARRLKQILDEQSSFTSEQIEIAIHALENDLEKGADQSMPKVKVPKDAYSLKRNQSLYESLQNELNGLNVHASRINALRKELIKLETRLKNKNKLFNRLSKCGDHVFPRRKELVREMSELFLRDVEAFAGDKEINPETVASYRREIKALQSFTKLLSLNTQAFSKSRQLLSECWEKMKVLEEKLHEKHVEKKEEYEKNRDDVKGKIEEIQQFISNDDYSLSEALKKLVDIKNYMRKVELGRDEVQFLRDMIRLVEVPIKDKQNMLEKKRTQEIERQKEKKEQFLKNIEDSIQDLGNCVHEKEIDELIASKDKILELLAQTEISDAEKKLFEENLEPLIDEIEQRCENQSIKTAKNGDEKTAIVNEVLKSRRKRRSKIKQQLEYYRKVCGGSGLDFEKSMHYNTLIQREKEHLEKIDNSISELEKTIR